MVREVAEVVGELTDVVGEIAEVVRELVDVVGKVAEVVGAAMQGSSGLHPRLR